MIDNVLFMLFDVICYCVLMIGWFVIFEGYDVKVRIDDFFGGYIVVLGNIGSGKFCMVVLVF